MAVAIGAVRHGSPDGHPKYQGPRSQASRRRAPACLFVRLSLPQGSGRLDVVAIEAFPLSSSARVSRSFDASAWDSDSIKVGPRSLSKVH
jgi:hypothetical protein